MKRPLDFIAMTMMMAFALAACSESAPGATTSNEAAATQASAAAMKLPTLTLIGHASLKIKTREGVVIYIDPYYKGDYSEKADIILISHEHPDHNAINLVTQNKDCVVLRVKQTINQKDNSYNTFEYYGVKIEPVPASNKNHPLNSTNGFVLTFDGISVYHASDTSKIEQMRALKAKNIDYAFFPIDGQYNMGPVEATQAAEMVGAKHNIPFHINSADVKAFTPENLMLVQYGETIELSAQ
jgi:L-ascorbate metabolism protein UlaG (beta-lactamase superfamily)